MKFKELEIIDPIVRATTEAGYVTPTEIQSKAIPQILKGKDVLACAQTGTGKTAAFAIPILQNLHNRKLNNNAIKVLILAPTRELALQIDENFKTYSKFLNARSLAIYGGVKQEKQVNRIKNGIDILIATPGRLLDLMQQGLAHIDQVKTVVLDEADHMLDMGFINDVKKILAKLPKERQTLFFSATMPPAIRQFANQILNQPIEISVTPVSSTAEKVEQFVYFVEKNDKTGLLIKLLKGEALPRSLVFTRTKHGADKLAKQLSKTGIYAAAIHGNKSQNNRIKTLQDFKSNRIKVLVATDVASRGIDIDELPQVVNFELPNVPETYVHRIGRTGRAGKGGIAISFCDAEQKVELKDIQKLIGFQIPVKKLETV